MEPVHDLDELLATLTASRRPGSFAICSTPVAPENLEADVLLREDEDWTVICSAELARAAGLMVDAEWAWITLDVYSALEAVGLTAAVSARLAEQGIPANMLAGRHHDHVLVPLDRADDALVVLNRPS